jgi:Ca2+-binding RTX toxin-like protein
MASYELNGEKWGAVGYGTSGGQVTWSFATTVGAIYNFDSSISSAAYQQAIQMAFDAWEAVANIDFVQVADSSAVDIRLGWDSIDGANNIVGECTANYNPANGLINFAEIRFDDDEVWSSDPNYTGSSAINFYAVALHEIGHALGLSHSSDPSTIMYAFTGTAIDLTAGDIAGAQYIYGPSGSATTGPTNGDDDLIGTSGGDAIAALAGNDWVEGLAGNDTLTGNAGSDTIDGGTGNDEIWAGGDDFSGDSLWGGDGADTIGAGNGNDTVIGGYGGDLLFGGAGDDYVDVGIPTAFTNDGTWNIAWAGSGNDEVQGDSGDDDLGGGAGSDYVTGYAGDDILYGGAAASGQSNDDTLYGGSGYDTLYGGAGVDLMDGEGDDDLLFGGSDVDVINGGSGWDEIWGGTGNDILSGDTGGDLFGFGVGNGADTVNDFDYNEGDRLDLEGQSLTTGSNSFGDLVIFLSGGGSITFEGVDPSEFDSSWMVG